MDHLLFRRQFLLTLRPIDTLPSGWLLRVLSAPTGAWNLYTHPDLETTVSENEHCRLVLLGYLLDPFHTDYGNQELLDHLVTLNDFDRIIAATHILNGRFLLLYLDKNTFKIINDASGFRQLFFLLDNDSIHCGSTPDIIKAHIGAQENPDPEVPIFFGSKEYANNSNTWVGHDTIYKDLKKLPPNFELDLCHRKIKRFWPNGAVGNRTLEEVASRGAGYIKGCLQSALKRKPLHMGITAGWDSRVLLAASREIREKVFYYLNQSSDMDEDHPDILIPRKLSAKLGFELHVIEIVQDYEENAFRKIYFRNNFRANDALYPVFYHGYKHHFDDTFTVSGTLAEGSARKYYYSPYQVSRLNGTRLARTVKFGRNPYAATQLEKWLEESRSLWYDHQIDLLDLYQIEHESCNWCSHIAAEQDIVRDEVRPFNSRYLISLFWSLDNKFRSLHNPILYKRMIDDLWPEAGTIPVNPSWKSSIYHIMGFMRLDLLFFRIRIKFKLLVGKL